jgi:hypothetical protein
MSITKREGVAMPSDTTTGIKFDPLKLFCSFCSALIPETELHTISVIDVGAYHRLVHTRRACSRCAIIQLQASIHYLCGLADGAAGGKVNV